MFSASILTLESNIDQNSLDSLLVIKYKIIKGLYKKYLVVCILRDTVAKRGNCACNKLTQCAWFFAARRSHQKKEKKKITPIHVQAGRILLTPSAIGQWWQQPEKRCRQLLNVLHSTFIKHATELPNWNPFKTIHSKDLQVSKPISPHSLRINSI